jgi:hypothetical protein
MTWKLLEAASHYSLSTTNLAKRSCFSSLLFFPTFKTEEKTSLNTQNEITANAFLKAWPLAKKNYRGFHNKFKLLLGQNNWLLLQPKTL